MSARPVLAQLRTGLLGAAGMLLAPLSARAQAPVAIVEDVQGKSSGVEFMDYVAAGKVIRLGADDRLVLGYLASCWRETITGGKVTIGRDESTVEGGRVTRVKQRCDTGNIKLTSEGANKSGAMAFRAPPKKAAGKEDAAARVTTVYGLSPLFEIGKPGRLVIERTDRPGEKHEIDVTSGQLVNGAFFDLAKTGKALSAGAQYRATHADRQVAFQIDAEAGGPPAGVVSRLVRLAP